MTSFMQQLLHIHTWTQDSFYATRLVPVPSSTIYVTVVVVVVGSWQKIYIIGGCARLLVVQFCPLQLCQTNKWRLMRRSTVLLSVTQWLVLSSANTCDLYALGLGSPCTALHDFVSCHFSDVSGLLSDSKAPYLFHFVIKPSCALLLSLSLWLLPHLHALWKDVSRDSLS